MSTNHTGRTNRKPGGSTEAPRFFRLPVSQRASSLVTTLLVLVVLSTIIVAFLQSMSVERSVAKSAANTYQGKLLADAAFDAALQRIQSIRSSGPYGAVFDLDASGSPYLSLAKREIQGGGVVTRRIPLFSTAQPMSSFTNLAAQQIDAASRTVPDLDAGGASVARTLSVASDIVCNMNSASSSFPNGLVGLMNGAAPRELPVNWIYVNDSSGRIIGRYAFWTDDECSKMDLRFAGQTANASGSHSRGHGTNASDLSLLAFTNMPLNLGLTNIANLYAMRNVTNVGSRASFVQYSLPGGGSVVAPTLWELLRPFVTVYSLNDDRSPDGKRKMHLNAVVSSTNTAARIQKEVFAIRDAITNNLPQFGTRFFSSPSIPTASEQQIYATKIAANIRDYVDTNSIATIIQSDGTAYSSNSPGFIPAEPLNTDLPISFGKERGPFLSEYFRVVRVTAPDPHPATSSTTPVDVTVRFGHYIELHNPTGQAITYADLGPSPFVLLSNRTSWNNTVTFGSPSVLRLADIKIRLPSSFTIPAGGYAVLTTDGPPWRDSQSDYIGSTANRYPTVKGSGPGQWELITTGGEEIPVGADYEDYVITTAAVSGQNYAVQNAGPDSPTYSDQHERLSFGNADGLIDYSQAIYASQALYLARGSRNPNWVSTFLADSSTFNRNTPNNQDTEARFTRGDVRSNTEISEIGFNNTSACWKQGSSGAYGDSLAAAPQQTIGIENFKSSTQTSETGVQRWRQWWYEYSSDPAGNHFLANRPMTSTGELGSVYDPVRFSNAGYRSQGATLRVGQSDSGTNNRANSTVTGYVSWLGGRGSDDVTNTNYMQNAFLLMDVFRTDDVTSGRVNPNSIVRDPSALAFRAVLDRFVFETAATNQASLVLSGLAVNATNSISSLRSFATNPANGFLVSAGDLSRAPLFWGATNALAGISMQTVSDAGKEEFMRRSANLLSTQSLAFTVFIRAESGSFVRDLSGRETFRVKGATTRETVVQLQPMYPPVADPAVPAAPTNWSVIKPRSLSY